MSGKRRTRSTIKPADREFFAAADPDFLTGRSALAPREAAQRIVSHHWAYDAVKAAQERKRCAA